ncbi:hypothetical protein Hanom_Chr04g00316771 [Helianthus anomalus]
MFWFCCQFAPCGEQNGNTNNLDGVRGEEQTGKKHERRGANWQKNRNIREQNGYI